jgi:hypothetical protein
MVPTSSLEELLVSAFERALASVPTIEVANSQRHVRMPNGMSSPEADAIIQIHVNGKPMTLLVEAKSDVYPRDAREAVWQLRTFQNTLSRSAGPAEIVPVLISNSLSESAKGLLREEKIGYFEEGGSLFLTKGDLYILLDRPPSKKAARITRNIFSGSRASVLLALMQAPQSWHNVKDLSDKALVSPGTVSQVFSELEKREWAVSRGGGPNKERKLQDPRSILDAWSGHAMQSPRSRATRYFVPSLKPEELMHRIDQRCKELGAAYAITGEWAAQIYSPFLSSISQVRCRFPADQPISNLTADLGARVVTEGSNFEAIETHSHGPFLFCEEHRGVRLANPVVVYLDLLRFGGRARELAEHLRQERIHL